jgi:hypothetical protein
VCNEFTAKEIDTSNASQKHAWKKSKLLFTVKSGGKSANSLNNFRFKTVANIKARVVKTNKVSSDKKLNGAERTLVIKKING